MKDPIGEATEELRLGIIADGYSEELLTEIASEFGVRPESLVNRFTVTIGKHPSMIAQGQRPASVDPAIVHQKLRAWVRKRDWDGGKSPLIGRKFHHEGVAYLYAGRWRYGGTWLYYAFRVRDGQRHRFTEKGWQTVIKPQLEVPQKVREF